VLSDKSRPIVQATLPVVADHIQKIATRFNRHLFGNHPQLLEGLSPASDGAR
jgi:nitric oxide dioxygenase